MADPTFDPRPRAAAKPLLSTSFTLKDLARVRGEVEAASRRCGLDDDQVEDWITAVNELMINAIRHGGGRGTVRLLLVNDRMACEIGDCGPGFNIADYVPRRERPSLSSNGGMGLWVVEQMTKFLLLDSGPAGTTIRITPRTGDAGEFPAPS
ncbi:ATP-binding protein [Verrucosispora sp. WMMA2044]|uniref:ATP-binding protein n=1 Tax=Verrucosispora sioxanthis TaxID=2499994 RepID=A0A6M1LDG8_9ACTN|nr:MULTISPECIES: ATP-binding protein [Micromonospora]NEE67142.1 ATP-binding protein [Verrucosispora sioxanthis]NGM16252.1 ATP-binding protein [Verrucosispora sioxanthis]WBB51555.1 ATP-binding protein [Verrucosispora sp. WMMA2044]